MDDMEVISVNLMPFDADNCCGGIKLVWKIAFLFASI
jgi:hypothetical protein